MDFQIEQRGRDYWARTGQEPAFFVGRSVRYQGRQGLSNAVPGVPLVAADVYRAEDYAETLGIWAYVIAPTIACEGGRFTALNSYDRAAFSFGIGQFAAHVAEGDFVCLVRALLALPEAKSYFPDLILEKGRISLRGAHPQPLDEATTTAALMAWLNPDPAAIDAAEVQAAARLIHWMRTRPSARRTQVTHMVARARQHMQCAMRKLSLASLSGSYCVVLIDLLHHGRGGAGLWPKVAAALAAPDPLAALLAIGAGPWAGRVAQLRGEIAKIPELGCVFWDGPKGDFRGWPI
ncbi:MAG: hypothetical protein KGN98_01525 [Alphaproteobacteria bacterium]|nr:hypothetical protein [Alphaproteobacteria bacterium]